MKKCSKCKIEKSFEEFSKNKNKKDGFQYYCKSCLKEYRKNNKKYYKKYYENNKEKIKDYYKQYCENNKEKIKELNKQWRGNNKDYKKQKSKTDSIYKLRIAIRKNISRAFKRNTNQLNKNAKTEKILGCTISEFILYIQSQFKKGMTFENHGLWHLDHIIPLSTATTEEEIIKLNHYTNFQPLWAKENLSKGNKIIEKQLKLL